MVGVGERNASVAPDVVVTPAELAPRATAYSLLPPTPPHLQVPAYIMVPPLVLPHYDGAPGEDLAVDELRIVTEVEGFTINNTGVWEYKWRRQAQAILPFMYLGPNGTAKDRKFLQDEGITMLLAVRNSKTALAGLMNGERVAKELGIASATVDVKDNQELIAAYPRFVEIVNDHLLSVYHQQAPNGSNQADGNLTIDKGKFKSGKVLVYCESGNERSAACCAAYIMAIYRLELIPAIQLMHAQRLCVNFTDDIKCILLAFQDILQAQLDVKKVARDAALQTEVVNGLNSLSLMKKSSKRSLGDTGFGDRHRSHGADWVAGMIDDDDDDDEQSFEGRSAFVPFSDSPEA